MPTARIPARINLALSFAIVAAHAAVLFVLPAAVSLPQGFLVAAAIAVAIGTPTHWALIHEAIHGLLLKPRAANDQLARLLAILFGVPFRAVRFAHLRHHRYNRTPWGREEIYDPATRSVALAHAMHYARITFGLYLGELALSLLCWLPRPVLRRHVRALCPDPGDGMPGMADVAERELLGRAALAETRFDAVCLISVNRTTGSSRTSVPYAQRLLATTVGVMSPESAIGPRH